MKCPNCNLCFNTLSIPEKDGSIKLYKYCEICDSVYKFNRTQLFKVEDKDTILLVKEMYKRRILNASRR